MQKTMMWKGVALVEAPESSNKDVSNCSGCFFSRDGEMCIGSEHMQEGNKVFGGFCGHRNVIYIPAPAQTAASDAEWIEAKVDALLKHINKCLANGTLFRRPVFRTALLAAIARGRGE